MNCSPGLGEADAGRRAQCCRPLVKQRARRALPIRPHLLACPPSILLLAARKASLVSHGRGPCPFPGSPNTERRPHLPSPIEDCRLAPAH